MRKIILYLAQESMDTGHCDRSRVSRRVKQVVTLQPRLGSRERNSGIQFDFSFYFTPGPRCIECFLKQYVVSPQPRHSSIATSGQ